MRTAEWIQILVFSFLLVLAGVRKLPRTRKAKALGIGLAGLAVTIISALLPAWIDRTAASVWRDWLPAALILLVYWESGQFFVSIKENLQNRLARQDARLVAPAVERMANARLGQWVLAYLEIAYLFCYPMIPLSLGAVYLAGMRSEADRYWAVVLPATYFCYCLVPFTTMLPPRMLGEGWSESLPRSPIRRFNLRILRTASIHANTFPSAHVAASIASGLVLTRLDPPVGLAFLWAGVSIAFGAVFGRYHYAADAVLGGAAALVSFLVERALAG